MIDLTDEQAVKEASGWFFWDFSGARFIWRKIVPETQAVLDHPDYQKPSTFFLWLITLYFAAFGLAAQLFESRLDKIEHKANILVAQLATPQFKNVLGRIDHLQKLRCRIKPILDEPTSILASLLSGETTDCVSVVAELKTVVEDWKDSLQQVDFSDAQLQGVKLWDARANKARFSFAQLQKADFENAQLQEANFWDAQLQEANFRDAQLQEANFWGAQLQEANFWDAQLQEADFWDAQLQEANFWDANLSGARNLTIDQLLQVETLYQTTGLDPTLEQQLRAQRPALFDEPD